ncbi:MAG: HNH endonuclease signature motif containing protein [Acidimicrobiales bacterium]
MLKRVENVSIVRSHNFLTGRGWMMVTIGKNTYRIAKVTVDELEAMKREQERSPVAVSRIGERIYWWFRNRFYWDNDNLTPSEVYALIVAREQRLRQHIATAQAIVALDAEPRSSPRGGIPDDVKQYVWARDRARCRNCGSTVELQFDHIIPVALGGASVADNLQVLCGSCNRRKGIGLGVVPS